MPHELHCPEPRPDVVKVQCKGDWSIRKFNLTYVLISDGSYSWKKIVVLANKLKPIR